VMREQASIVLANIVRELQGEMCLKLDELMKPKKNIMSSKSFGNAVKTYQAIAEALSDYAARAAEKLRAQRSLATEINIFLETIRFNTKIIPYARSMKLPLPFPTNDSGLIIQTAKKALLKLYKPNLSYHKTGILLGELLPDITPLQLDLFQTGIEEKHTQKKSISQTSKTMDSINQRFGRNTLFLASQKTHAAEAWQLRAEFKSPNYTTQLRDIIRTKS
jgi:DNA polymerase V